MMNSRMLSVGTGKWIVGFLLAAAISVSAGCGGGGDATAVQNAPPPVASDISVAFQPAPPGSVFVNGTVGITAVVSNDSSNAGVDWSLTCTNTGSCGSLSPLHTASGAAATYTPPSVLSGNSQTVNIAAFATTDHSKNVAAPVTVAAFGASLKGRYVLQTSGTNLNVAAGLPIPYQFAGVIDMDGNGGITSGEQTINYFDQTAGSLLSVSDAITGGKYYVGADGRGSITLNTNDQNIGQQGVEVFTLTVLSSSHALIAKIDDPNIQVLSYESSAGTMDLQTSATAPTRGYAFVVNGTDTAASPAPMAFGGVLNIDSPNVISGTGSVADQEVCSPTSFSCTPARSATLAGTVSGPDSFGAIKFDLSAGFTNTPIQLTGYMVDATHIKLIESDNRSGTGFASTGGVAIGQGAATGTFTGNSSFSGTYVFGILGQDLSGLPTSLAGAGMFTADGNGKLIRGVTDEFLGGLFYQTRDQFNGSYSADSSGTGRVDSFITFRHHGVGPEFIFYLTGNGNPLLVLDADANSLYGGAGVATGMAYPATTPFAFSGEYGLSFAQSSFGSENDGTGVITVNGTATPSLSGVVDTNFFFSPVPATPLTGDFLTIPTTGRFQGELSNELLPASPSSTEYYVIDSDHAFFVETDFLSTGNLSFGYVARRTPVCTTCQ